MTTSSNGFFDVRRATVHEKHRRYHQSENWGTSELSEEDRINLERHRELIGEPIYADQFDRTNARRVGSRITANYRECRRIARELFSGRKVLPVFEGMYQALVFGQSGYVEGSSGVAKTAMMRALYRMIDAPLAEFDASADASDLNLIGGEIPGTTPNGGLSFTFRRGPVLKPGALGLMIDELPRLPANASNVLLQAMAERRLNVSLVATGGGDHTVLLSPNFFVLGVGNPVGYGGQGERSLALYDRFSIGLYMPHPGSSDRIEMYKRFEKGVGDDPMAPLAGSPSAPEEVEGATKSLGFTFREAHAALRMVTLPDELRERLCAMSFAVSPKSFRERVDWTTCKFFSKLRAGDKETSLKLSEKELRKLEQMVNDYLIEGSNPRGELHGAIRNAQIQCLMDADDDDSLVVKPRHLARAFEQANLVRLKPTPGCEEQAAAIIEQAIDVFLPGVMESAENAA